MKTVHATAHGPVSITEASRHGRAWPHITLELAENGVCMVVLLVCEVVALWWLLTAMYFAPWPVS